MLALEAKVQQLQKNVQRKVKQVQLQPAKPMGKAQCEGRITKKEKKPFKPEWLMKHTPPKADAIKCYRE